MGSQKYLFRGKRKEDGQWIEGHHSTRKRFIDVRHYIQPIQKGETVFFEVKPETVGQWIRKDDIKGRGIFEGDIVQWGHVPGGEEKPVRVAVVELAPDIQFKQIGKYPHNHVFRYGNFIYKDTENWLEIIGNIHDNPELLTTTPQ